MKTRRHHNNDGRRRIKLGHTRDQVKAMAKRLGVRYGENSDDGNQHERGLRGDPVVPRTSSDGTRDKSSPR
jgi:hypothetical protein